MVHTEITQVNPNSGWKSYLPFTDAHALSKVGGVSKQDPLKLCSKVGLASAAALTGTVLLSSVCPPVALVAAPELMAAAATCQVLMSPILAPALAVLAGGAVLVSEGKAKEDALVEDFIQAKTPSFQLMQRIYQSPAIVKKLLEKTASQPEILLKRNAFGKTILSEFVEHSRFEFPFYLTAINVVFFHGPGAEAGEVDRNNEILRPLLKAAPWPKDELDRCEAYLSANYPDTLFCLRAEGLLGWDTAKKEEVELFFNKFVEIVKKKVDAGIPIVWFD